MAKTPKMPSGPTKPTLWADDPLDNERYDDLALRPGRYDSSYVPGYTEARIDNAHRVKKGLQPKPIPRLQWVRGSNRQGEDLTLADEAMVNWRTLGYRAMGTSDLERYGFGFPPAAHLAPDGTIRRQDAILFFVDENRAQINRVNEEAERVALRGDRDEISRPTGIEIAAETSSGAAGQTLEDVKRSIELPTLGE